MNIINEQINICPKCGAEGPQFIDRFRAYMCFECNAKFDAPLVREKTRSEKLEIMQMVSEEPPIDVRSIKAFLGTSTALVNERSAVTTEIARLNGQDMSFYINMYHCEHDDKIKVDGNQQDEYNKKIKESDLFLLLIDNSEVGMYTLNEVILAIEGRKKLAVFVRKGTPDGGENNIRWQEFIEKNRDIFFVYCEYVTLSDLEKCTDKLYAYVKELGDKIGTLTEKCNRYTYDILLTGTDGCSDEYLYVIGDMFNTKNNMMFEEDELCSLVFRLNFADPFEDIPDDIIDYYFMIRRKDDKIINMIKGCYDKADPVTFFDVNVFKNEDRDAMWNIISSISSVLKENYLYDFNTRSEMENKESVIDRIATVRERYEDLLKGVSEYRRGNYLDAVKYLDRAAEYHFVSAYFHLGVIYADEKHSFYDVQKAMEYWHKAADKGNIMAQNNHGFLLYKTGRTKEAENYFRMAAENGNAMAQNNLGNLLKDSGRTTEAEKYYRMAVENEDTNFSSVVQFNLGNLLKDLGRIKDAEKYWRMAAENGNTYAQYNLGSLLYELGRTKEAEKHLRMVAEKGEINAQNYLGCLLNVSCKTKEAEKYFRMAAENGDTNAQYNLGNLLYELGRTKEAEKYFVMAAENGYTNAQYNLGVLLYKSSKTKEAEKYFRMAAENGDTKAQCNLGVLLYKSGRTEEAEKYYRMAADKGYTEAQFNLGLLLYGSGKTKEVKKYFVMAAKNGHTKSQFFLGLMLYESGRTEEAEKYYRMAAESGDEQAMFNLGYLYEHTDRPSKAEKYYLKALKKGHAEAKEALDRLKNG